METRRDFLKKTTALTALGLFSNWASAKPASDKLGEILPQRQIIRDGKKTTSFCMGGYHLGLAEDEKEAERMVERAIEMGVRFFDNARVYHRGYSEELYGKFLTPKYRDNVFMMTKSVARTAEDAWKDLDLSLTAMKTDYVDLWQIHTVTDNEDVDNRLNNGVLDVFLEAKEKGKAKYVGFTAHQNPSTIMHFLDHLDKRGMEMDTCQMPLNVVDPNYESFQKYALPALLDKGYGVIAMKTMSGGSMMGKRIDTTPQHIKTEDIPNVVEKAPISYAELHQYVYALPISSLCSGCDTMERLEHNIKVLQNLKKLSKSEMKKIEKRVEPWAGNIVENYKRVFN
jgi:predicted aldo/keto reductase-like oxidoreductase